MEMLGWSTLQFQSTLPVWGATGTDSNRWRWPIFQSTLPVWGATFSGNSGALKELFQSTLPVWGATLELEIISDLLRISIHAPRVGSDDQVANAIHLAYEISIHAPRVGSDKHDKNTKSQDIHISIHAPRVGSDSKTAQILLEILSHLNSFAPSEKKKIPFHRKEQGKFIEIF